MLQNQGVSVQPNAEFRPIDPKLLYNYTSNTNNAFNPVGYVEDGQRRLLSTSSLRNMETFRTTSPPHRFNEYRQEGFLGGSPSEYGYQHNYSNQYSQPNQYYQENQYNQDPEYRRSSHVSYQDIEETPIQRTSSRTHPFQQPEYE